MKFIFAIFLLVSSLFSSVSWQHDYNKALKLAKVQDKRVYLLIVSKSCGWCRKFENTTLKDETILKRLDKDYILLHLIRGVDDIPKKFKTSPIPRHYFLTKNGKIIFPVVGYRDVESFNSFLDTVNERFKRMK